MTGLRPALGHVCRDEGVAFKRELIGDPSGPVPFPVVPSFSRPYRLPKLPVHARLVVDTDVASFIFKWHPVFAPRYGSIVVRS